MTISVNFLQFSYLTIEFKERFLIIICRPGINLSLQEAITLKAGTDLYHYAYGGKLKENRDDYIFVTKDMPAYGHKIIGVFESSFSRARVYQFKTQLTLRFPDRWDEKLLKSISSYLNSPKTISSISLNKRQNLQDIKDCFEELFTGVYLDDGPNLRIMTVLIDLAKYTDFPEKYKYNGFHDTKEGYDNYCIFRWRSKLEVTGCWTYKEFTRRISRGPFPTTE